MKFAHTNIISNDWRELSEFYMTVFGCTLVPPVRKQKGKWLEKGTGVSRVSLEGAHLRLPGYGESGPTLEIYQYQEVLPQEPIELNRRGLGHIAFETSNIKGTIAKIISNGGSLNGELTTRTIEGVGVLSFVYARDPEGNLIELQTWKQII